MSKSVSAPAGFSVPAFVARAAGDVVGDPAAPDRAAALGGDPVAVGCSAAKAAVASAVAAQMGGWADRDLVARAAGSAAAAGLPAGSFLVDPSWRSPVDYVSGLVAELPSCNGSLAILESKAAAVYAVLAAFDQFGLVSTADLAGLRSSCAAVVTAVAADVAARAGWRY
jgi:hypothetical protein